MIEGILWAIGAGVMLGLYAMPEKYIKGYQYENTWFLFFLIALIGLPLISATCIVNNFGAVVGAIPTNALMTMAVASILWGLGVQLWSKAIDYIGMSLGFSIFIGTVILVGSILPFFVVGLPSSEALGYIIAGLVIILAGILANGRAGILRNNESAANTKSDDKSKKVMAGIAIAVVGGLFATGFSLANAVGITPITEAVIAQGNPEWMNSVAVMIVIYISGAIYVIPYFIYKLCKNGTWGNFKEHVGQNITMAFIMAFFNFAASAAFAYAAYSLGSAGNTVGYAIYNTSSVLLAVVGGIIAKEWVGAPAKARTMLYFALISMIVGVVLIALGNSVA